MKNKVKKIKALKREINLLFEMCKKYNKSKTFVETYIEDIKNNNTVKNNTLIGICYYKNDDYIAVLTKSYFEREKNKIKDYFLFDEYMELDK